MKDLNFSRFFLCFPLLLHQQRFVKSASPNIEDVYYWNSSDPRRYPWLKICDETTQYEIQPGAGCSKGVHFPETYIPGCVCPFGLHPLCMRWLVKTKVCEMHTHFLLGDARRDICYLIDFPIESLLYLGDPDNVYAEKAFVAPHQLSAFYEIPLDGRYTPLLDLDKPLIVLMFPSRNRSIETEDGNCFPIIQQNKANAPVHIWSASLGPSRYRIVTRCRYPLNFGFDDLIAPNMVFVRSNAINAIPVPKKDFCTPDQVNRCNEYSTTNRPIMQPFTPANHETLYFDLAKMTEEEIDKAVKPTTIPKHYFDLIEVEDPLDGNFSEFYTEKVVQIELPVLINSKIYSELLKESRREQAERLRQLGIWDQGDDHEGSFESGETSDELLESIVRDIVRKDTALIYKSGVMNHSESIHGRGRSVDTNLNYGYDDEYEEVDDDDDEEKNMLTTTEKQVLSNISKENAQRDKDESAPLGAMNFRNSSEHHYSSTMLPLEAFNNASEPQTTEHNTPSTTRHLRRKRKLIVDSDKFVGLDMSGMCKGIERPPHCHLQSRRYRKSDHKRMWKKLQSSQFSIKSPSFLEIKNLIRSSAEFFEKSCQIPEEVVRTNGIADVVTGFVVQLLEDPEFQKISSKSFEKQSITKTHMSLDKCRHESGVIDFLFETDCPLQVSCMRYTAAGQVSVKIITGQDTIPIAPPQRTILATTFQAVIDFLGFMCRNNLPSTELTTSSFDALARVYDFIANTSNTHKSKFSDRNIQIFLKIPSVHVYLSFLGKCVSAAETILSGNREHVPFGDFVKRARRAANIPKLSPRVMDGKAICMSSYWDGFNKQNQEHQCISQKALRR